MNISVRPNAWRMPAHRHRRPSVDLYWLPLGAGQGGQCVRGSGRAYEALVAARLGRRRLDLFHSALVGAPTLGRLRLFRYEIRCWRDGTIPDAAAAVDSPRRVSDDETKARQLLRLVASCPVPTRGRDELHTGEMWNSNSVTSWLLQQSGHDTDQLHPPMGGRDPAGQQGPPLPSAPDPLTAEGGARSCCSRERPGVLGC